GTATEGSAATSDYEVIGDFGEVEIKAGQTTGTLELAIKSDASFETSETIEVSIDDVNSDNIDITNDDEIVITITDDDVKAKIAFAAATLTVDETNRNIQIQVTLDKAVPSNISVPFTLTGTAVDSVKSEADEIPADYQIKGETGITRVLQIASGQTTGVIDIKSYSDFYLEDDETIIITLQAGDQVELGTISATTITVTQEDGKAIALFWDEAYTTVDMDLFLWIGELGDPVSEFGVASLSAFADFDGPEIVFIPDIFEDAAFGSSYTYYEGTENPMEFEVQFVDFVDGVAEVLANRDVFTASYTLANINKWDATNAPEPIIVQTFNITGGVYSAPSSITVPPSGSRVGSPTLPSSIEKQTTSQVPSERMRKLINTLKK
ncbi:MAG: hypothetical protein C0490_01280, partial [Marivirga sp.]|nr:hypothetical protein [Marivirga sp.]